MNTNIFSLVLLFCVVHGAPSSNNIINIRVSNGRNHTNKLNLLLRLQRLVESSAETNVEVDLLQNPEICANNETRQVARIPQEAPLLPGNGHTTEWPNTTRFYRRNTTAKGKRSTSEPPATTLDGTSTRLFPEYEQSTAGPHSYWFYGRDTTAEEERSTSELPTTTSDGTSEYEQSTEGPHSYWYYRRDTTAEEERSTSESPATTLDGTSDYRYISGYGWYKFKKGDYDWAAARRECQNDGADLMVPDSHREREVVYREMNPQGYWVTMGVHDPGRNGTWVTVRGDPVPESWWAPGEPDSEGEYCGRAHTTGQLIVASCSSWRFVLCELS